MFFSVNSSCSLQSAGSHSLSLSTCSHMKAVMLLTLCSHFYEWLRLHNKRGREGGRTAPRPASALSQQRRWIPRVVASAARVTTPWLTSLDTEGVERSGVEVWGGLAWTHRYHRVVQVLLLQPIQSCPLNFPRKIPELWVWVWEPESIDILTFVWETAGLCSRSWSDKPICPVGLHLNMFATVTHFNGLW